MGIIMIFVDIISACVKQLWYFFKCYIDICDAILTAAVVYYTMTSNFDWSKGWSAVLGLLVAIIAFVVFHHRFGFWIASVGYSLIWSLVAVMASYVMLYNLGDMLTFSIEDWMLWVSGGIAFAFTMYLHACAKHRVDAEFKEIDDEQAARTSQQPQAVQELWYDPRCGELRPINTKPLEAYEPDWEYKQMKIRMEREARTK